VLVDDGVDEVGPVATADDQDQPEADDEEPEPVDALVEVAASPDEEATEAAPVEALAEPVSVDAEAPDEPGDEPAAGDEPEAEEPVAEAEDTEPEADVAPIAVEAIEVQTETEDTEPEADIAPIAVEAIEAETEAEQPEAEDTEPGADIAPIAVEAIEVETETDQSEAEAEQPEAAIEAPQAESEEVELVDAAPGEVVEAAEDIAAAAADLDAAGDALEAAEVELDEAEAKLEEAEEIAAAPAEELPTGGPGGLGDADEVEVETIAVALIEVAPDEPAAEAEQEVGGTFVGVEDGGLETSEPEAEEVLVAAFAPLRPGDVAQTSIAVWQPDALETIRAQVRDVQARFVDEPAEAVAQIRALVSDAVHTLADALLAEQLGSIDPHQHSDSPDTESLRVALRRYREFLDRVLAL
jgi:hypothetical protein